MFEKDEIFVYSVLSNANKRFLYDVGVYDSDDDDESNFWMGHPKAGSLKTVPLPFPDLCAALFDGNSATGSMKWTSSQTTSVVGSFSCQRVQQLLITDSIFHDIEDDADNSHQNSEPTPDPTADTQLFK
ncbi:hypothetical protein R6Q59_032735 [Mikania micrantha]